jgi:hypothetical protein
MVTSIKVDCPKCGREVDVACKPINLDEKLDFFVGGKRELMRYHLSGHVQCVCGRYVTTLVSVSGGVKE